MALIKVTGIVMRYANYKDYDRIITLFTLQHGKITALARGARRPKSTLLNASEQFCMAEYVLIQRKDRYIITSSTILDSFYDIRSDIDSYYAASYFSAVCQAIIQEEQPEEELYSIFAKLLAYLSHSDTNKFVNLIIALCILIDTTGFRPEINFCGRCGESLKEDEVYYNVETGVFTCRSCKKPQDVKMSKSAIKVLAYIFYNKEKLFGKVDMDEWLIKEIITYLTKYLEIKIEKNLKQTNLLLSII